MEPEKQIDAALDSALRKYGHAEPRPGLEGRVLANLRAESERRNARRHWWPALVAVSAILVIGAGIFVGREQGGARNEIAAEPAPIVRQNSSGSGITAVPVANISPSKKITRPVRPVLANQTADPRLEQFPSPQPLSEQEQMLARYVEELPAEAQQIAQAQTELARQSEIEFEKQGQLANPSGDSP
jgi:hypothetical protein